MCAFKCMSGWMGEYLYAQTYYLQISFTMFASLVLYLYRYS